MKAIAKNTYVSDKGTKEVGKITGKAGVLWLIEINGKTVRRTEKAIHQMYDILESTEDIGTHIEKTKKVLEAKRPKKDVSNIKRDKTVTINVEDIETKALQALQGSSAEETVHSLTFNPEVGMYLQVPKHAIRMLSKKERVSYVSQKMKSADEWFKLLVYSWMNREVLRRYNNWERVEELGIHHIQSGHKVVDLDFHKTKRALDHLIKNFLNGHYSFEDFDKVVKTLPNSSADSELSYYLYTIIGDIFQKSEWGILGLTTEELKEALGSELYAEYSL